MPHFLPLLALLAADITAPVRIGFGEARPYCYSREDGRPAGFLIELFDEAARREGLPLEWTRVDSSEENNRALAEGRLHILPMAVVTAERRRLFEVTEPWWAEATILLVRPGDEAHPKRIALPRPLVSGAREHYRDAVLLPAASATEALAQVCRGAADAALVGSTFIRDLVSNRPPECESLRLGVHDAPVSVDYSILAGRPSADVAQRLRRRLTEMTADGTLARVAAMHPPVSAPQAMRMTEALRASYESQRLRIFALCLMGLLGVGLYALIRQRRTQRKLRRLIEQQKATQRELRASEAALTERTLELVRSNEDLQAFAYSVSHDLQEPVRTQALYSQLLERRFQNELPPEAVQLLRVIRTSALRTQETMQSLLKYSRAGHSDRLRALVDCNVVVDRVLTEMRGVLAESGARVRVEPLPRVWGWEDRLHQVFQNLIGNAAKYRRPGVAPDISVAATRDGANWQFAVSDNGIGFRQEYAEKVFGLFKRLHGYDVYGGSGIGLALCKRVVERHGGRIWAVSREGEGSTFFFTIPATNYELVAEGARSASI